MNKDKLQVEEQKLYEVERSLLYCFLKYGMKMDWGKGSLFEGHEEDEPEDILYNETYLTNPIFQKTCRIMTQPDFVIALRIGGGITPYEIAYVYMKESEGDSLVMVMQDGEHDEYAIKYHSHYKQFTQWLSDHVCTDCGQNVPNFMPPNLSLKEFYLLLHTIDSYRRRVYENMINYEFTNQSGIALEAFNQSLVKAIKSEDIRWLLPSLEQMLPELKAYGFELDTDDYKILIETGFIDHVAKDEQDRLIIFFGESAIASGNEFMQSWLLSAGLEFTRITADDIYNDGFIFMAPTAISNHFCEIKASQDQVMVNHQVFTKEYVKFQLNQWFEHLYDHDRARARQGFTSAQKSMEESIPEEVSRMNEFLKPKEPQPSHLEKETKQVKYCSHCGEPIKAGAKFCQACGMVLD